ncbi:ATP-binding protein [Arthrobacter wenxiniae]|uniref:PspC domain-containing protein n=1 Tax=Arthrobacter wenxiniae TaxID=2713570 RepID=A0A7Y7ID88_9MICC|nr:ATP-binding protein [Arthrobacter wenxiniae]NVM93318.1 PspC domain-containing protein [Arthrobacter wenxiniae]
MSAKMYRSTDRMVAGVCAGLAEHLGLPVRAVRAIMAGSCFFFGAGLVFYAWLWILVPLAGEDAPAGARPVDDDGAPRLKLFRPAPAGAPGPDRDGPASLPAARRAGASMGLREILIGGALVAAALALFGAKAGVNLDLGTLIPLGVIAAGAVLAWMQLDATRRVGLLNAARMDTPWSIARFAAGIVLVVAGVLIIVTGSGSWTLVWASAVASLAVLAGVGLVLAPWVLKFWRDFQSERAGRIRETQRAEIAAHLHDSVLQTLALIQKRADSPQDVGRLARAQERELRSWIYQDEGKDPGKLVAGIQAACAEVEDVHGLPVEVVSVGDAELDESTRALVQATREAVLNGVRHGGTAVSVYVEAGGSGVDVFVKDRGAGFDWGAVPPDRLGVRESVVGRMQRNGGSAEIISSTEGTEVRLHLPARPAPAGAPRGSGKAPPKEETK